MKVTVCFNARVIDPLEANNMMVSALDEVDMEGTEFQIRDASFASTVFTQDRSLFNGNEESFFMALESIAKENGLVTFEPDVKETCPEVRVFVVSDSYPSKPEPIQFDTC